MRAAFSKAQVAEAAVAAFTALNLTGIPRRLESPDRTSAVHRTTAYRPALEQRAGGATLPSAPPTPGHRPRTPTPFPRTGCAQSVHPAFEGRADEIVLDFFRMFFDARPVVEGRAGAAFHRSVFPHRSGPAYIIVQKSRSARASGTGFARRHLNNRPLTCPAYCPSFLFSDNAAHSAWPVCSRVRSWFRLVSPGHPFWPKPRRTDRHACPARNTSRFVPNRTRSALTARNRD